MKNIIMNFPRLFITNIKTILFALALSLIIWFAISFQLFPDVPRTIPAVPITSEISAFMRDSRLELAEEFAENIDITIIGKRYEIGNFTADDFNVWLDFSEIVETGTFDVPVQIRPRFTDVEFLITTRETMRVTIIEVAQKTLLITTDPNLEGLTPVEGMTINRDGASVYPETVTIRGERSAIERISDARVNVSSPQPLSETQDLTGTLVFLDVDGRQLTREQSAGVGIVGENRAYTVTVPVFMERMLELIPDIANYPDNFDIDSLLRRITFSYSHLQLASPDSSIAGRSHLSLRPISLSRITISQLRDGIRIPVDETTLPEGYLEMSEPRITEVRLVFSDVDDYGQITLSVPATNFNVINPPAGYSVSPRARNVSITIVGPSSVIQAITVNDIEGTIDLLGLSDVSPGTRSVGGRFTIRGTDIQAWVVDPPLVEVIISRNS